MHIGFLSNEYPPLRTGGIGTSVRNLSRALVRAGHSVTVVGWGDGDQFEDQGVRIRLLEETSWPKLGWYLNRKRVSAALQRLQRQEGLDIIEAPDWCGMSAGIKAPCPLVIRCHGSAVYFGHLLSIPVRRTVRWTERLALSQADSVGAVSHFAGETTRSLFGLDGPIRVIPNGIDLRLFGEGAADEIDRGTVLYLGTLVRKKGVLDLCRAFTQIAAECPNARLVLIGRDTADKETGNPSTWSLCRNELSSFAAERVKYLGLQPYDRVQEYIRRAQVCVFPSYAEAMPLSWLESMACARPLVAYDIGWAPEIVTSGVNGVLVPRGDTDGISRAVVKLLRFPDGAYQLGIAARRSVESLFADDVIAQEALAWYQDVVAGRT